MEKTILLLEESEPLRKSIAFTLTGACYSLRIASSVDEAIEIAKEGSVDLLIADLHSCITTGLIHLEPLIGGSTETLLPAIILHNDLSGAYAITRSIRGKVRYITKPFSRDALLSAVYAYIGSPDHDARCSEM